MSVFEIDEHRSIVDSLERDIGRYDQRLIEPLLRLAEATMEHDQFAETESILDQAIQISRLNEGLYTNSQVPMLILSVKNDARRGNWSDARETLVHLAWFYREKFLATPEVWLDHLLELVDLHLEGFVRDHPDNQSFHFGAAISLTWTAIRVAERSLPLNDPRLADLYYRQAKNYFLEATVVERGGKASYQLREAPYTMIRLGYDFNDAYQGNPFSGAGVITRKDSNRRSYRMGLGLLQRLGEVYRHIDPPWSEAAAMVDLYIADWHLMFDSDGIKEQYELAVSSLKQAGVTEARINALLAVPQVLPIERFYPTVQLALDALDQNNLGFQSGQPGNAAAVADISFAEWSSGFPNHRSPVESVTLLPEEIEDFRTTLLRIELPGVRRVSKWANGRYVSQFSVPSYVQFAEQNQEFALSLEDLTERMHFLKFRPRLVDGVDQPFSGTLSYRYFIPWYE